MTDRSRIEDYAVLGDLLSAALVAKDGSIDWLCLPRFDSSACFAALLDTPGAGRWLLAPTGGGTCSRRSYRGDSLVLESVWDGGGGSVRVIDFMPPRGEAPDVVRIVEGISGRVEMRSEVVVRPDYGSVKPRLRDEAGRSIAVAGPDSLWLDTPVPTKHDAGVITSTFTMGEGDRVPFVLAWAPSYGSPPRRIDAGVALESTLSYWADWMGSCSYGGRYPEAVRRSLLTIKALTYAPTGGIAAAATTSLPEEIGGVRNWDYRYCWLRDAAFSLQALVGAGFTDEARAWRDWLLRAVAGDPGDLQIMYSLTGRRRIPEHELPWLGGYEHSQPVRVGNAAVGQFQLDVWGEVLNTLHHAREAGLSAEDDAWDLQCDLVEFLESAWERADSSLWEIRGPARHFVHSKVMAWAGFDRMIGAAERTGLPAPLDRWRRTREAIHRQVCEQGYDAGRNTFTQSYGSEPLDAALLLIPRLGFLPPDDARVAGTVRAVRRELCEDGFVLRYRTDDGLPGTEGAFVACTFWLADALSLIGERQEAELLFERLLDLRNDVGLLSEEWDPHARRQLGNTPQALSHLSLVNTAIALDRGPRHLVSSSP